MPASYIIGLTGGIGSGKSIVSRMFAELGVEIIDADEIARCVVAKGSPLLDAIVERLGEDILDQDGRLDRKRLRSIIFAETEQRSWLEGLLHPAIRGEIMKRIQVSMGSYLILMAPLLLESGDYDFIHRVLVVDAPESIQVARIRQRDSASFEEIEKIIAAQMGREERIARADDVIFNDASLEELRQKVAQLHHQYEAQARLFHQGQR